MGMSVDGRAAGGSQFIMVQGVPTGALEFLAVRLRAHGGSVDATPLPGGDLTEVRFGYPGTPDGIDVCRSLVAEWCGANFPGVRLEGEVEGRHRRPV